MVKPFSVIGGIKTLYNVPSLNLMKYFPSLEVYKEVTLIEASVIKCPYIINSPFNSFP